MKGHAIESIPLPARLSRHQLGATSAQHQAKTLQAKQPNDQCQRRARGVAEGARHERCQESGLENLEVPAIVKEAVGVARHAIEGQIQRIERERDGGRVHACKLKRAKDGPCPSNAFQ